MFEQIHTVWILTLDFGTADEFLAIDSLNQRRLFETLYKMVVHVEKGKHVLIAKCLYNAVQSERPWAGNDGGFLVWKNNSLTPSFLTRVGFNGNDHGKKYSHNCYFDSLFQLYSSENDK